MKIVKALRSEMNKYRMIVVDIPFIDDFNKLNFLSLKRLILRVNNIHAKWANEWVEWSGVEQYEIQSNLEDLKISNQKNVVAERKWEFFHHDFMHILSYVSEENWACMCLYVGFVYMCK